MWQGQSLILGRIIQAHHPKVMQSVIINTNCTIHVYINDTEVHRLGNYQISAVVHEINDLDLLVNHLRNNDAQLHKAKPCSLATLIHLVISLLAVISEDSFKH